MICEGCGCSEARPCIGPEEDGPCHWVEEGLCSSCAIVPSEDDSLEARILDSQPFGAEDPRNAEPVLPMPRAPGGPTYRNRVIPRRVA